MTAAEMEKKKRCFLKAQENFRAAAALLVTGDERAARLLAEEKEIFRTLEAEATVGHFEHLREGSCHS